MLIPRYGIGAVRDLFVSFDAEQSGTLDLAEFECVAEALGFGNQADEIFEDLVRHRHDAMRHRMRGSHGEKLPRELERESSA